MTRISWKARENCFVIVHPKVEAVVDPAKPGKGLSQLVIEGELHPKWELFGVRWTLRKEEPFPEASSSSTTYVDACGGCVLRDCWHAGPDLLAEYVPQFGEDASLTIRWRLSAPSGVDENTPLTVEMLFSIQAIDHQPCPRLCVTSLLACDRPQVAVFLDQDVPAMEPLQVPGPIRPGAVVLAECAGSRWWYQELIHPEDVQAAGVTQAGQVTERSSTATGFAQGTPVENAHCCRTWYRLFAEPLERGIIFRARARVDFYRGPINLGQVAQAYRQLLAGPPPLSD